MEIVKQYLDEVMKVDGIWILQIPNDITKELMTQIYDEWTTLFPEEQLIMMPKELSIHKRNKYSFYIALMLVKMGHRITRLEWARPVGNMSRAPYLMLEDVGADTPMLIRRFPDESEEDEFFFVGADDMDAEDYILAPKGE